MDAEILALLAGQAVPFRHGEASAIAKSPLQGPVRIGALGIEGDEQADLRVHGGPDKALHFYPFDHYPWWAAKAPGHPLLDVPGAFGETVSTYGLTEDQVCIGDRFRLGSALIEISQGREPCWKLAQRMEWSTLPKIMTREGRCGWYARVIEAGHAEAGDTLTLIDRPHSEWTVRRVFALIVGGDHIGENNALAALAKLPPLFVGWQQRAVELQSPHQH